MIDELAAEGGRPPIHFPATVTQLWAAGYEYTGQQKECDGCGGIFLWFRTPTGKWIPLTSQKDSSLVPHHAICAAVKQFRKASETHELRANGERG